MQATATDVTQIELIFLGNTQQEACKQFIGIGTVLVYIVTRVTACKTVDINLHKEQITGNSRPQMLEIGIVTHATSATDEHLALVLRIKIHKNVTLQKFWGKSLGTCKTGLLINCKKTVYRTMFQLLVGKYSHCSRHANTVIGTKSCSLSLQPFAIDPWTYGILCKVMINIGTLVTNHIHVTLQNYCLAVLITGIRRFLYKHITYRIGNGFITKFLSKVLKKSRNLGLVL